MGRKRRGRGEGSLFKRDDGQWVGRHSLGYNESRRPKRRTFCGATTGRRAVLQGSVSHRNYKDRKKEARRLFEAGTAPKKNCQGTRHDRRSREGGSVAVRTEAALNSATQTWVAREEPRKMKQCR